MTDLLTAARAEALFSSDLATGTEPTPAEIAAAIRRSIRSHGGSRGCACALAGAFGDRPETAVPRMRWALRLVRAVYPRTTPVATRTRTDRRAER
ncbi:hypothetical protein [Streptomyces geranii]|uniref:hypothetical protein n=1 Tax=Streptomyces geranii TaxID=2058923 RepID=UPI0018E4F85C|nr:hypothetical protein [Streptomyces geranii]